MIRKRHLTLCEAQLAAFRTSCVLGNCTLSVSDTSDRASVWSRKHAFSARIVFVPRLLSFAKSGNETKRYFIQNRDQDEKMVGVAAWVGGAPACGTSSVAPEKSEDFCESLLES